MAIEEGQDAKGIFGGSAPRYGGRRFNWQRRRLGALDRFAELLSEHDADEGGTNRGGNVAECARRMGIKPSAGNAMLQRIRKRLGPQAR